MKYIRTKDNIYEVYAREKRPNGCVITTSGVRVPYTDILHESNSIEELCDGFVYEYQTGARVMNKKIIAMPDIVKTYGAIWTNKGLIYVAKMNEKGELELL